MKLFPRSKGRIRFRGGMAFKLLNGNIVVWGLSPHSPETDKADAVKWSVADFRKEQFDA